MNDLGMFWKAREVAEFLRLDTKTIYAWVRKGKIHAGRTPTGYIRISDDEVKRIASELGLQEKPKQDLT